MYRPLAVAAVFWLGAAWGAWASPPAPVAHLLTAATVFAISLAMPRLTIIWRWRPNSGGPEGK